MKTSSQNHSPAAPAGGSLYRTLRSLAVACLALTGIAAFAENAAATVNFKDPAQPGRLKIYISQGDLHVRAGDSASEVSVKSDVAPKDQEPRKDGLRVLSDTSANFSLTVKDNVAELTYGKNAWPEGGSANFDVVVPRNTALEVENGWGGEIEVEKVAGDVEIRALNCEVKLVELAGSASVETMNGEIDASFAKISTDKPISISSTNGQVNLRIPADSKAKVRFRTHHGSILTDFPDDIIKTTSENLGGTDWAAFAGKHAAMAAEVAKEVGQEVAREVAHAAREMAQEFKEAQREAREAQKDAEEMKKDAEEARQEALAQKDEMKSDSRKMHIRAPRAPRPPSIPAISGGKVVSGTINGGGPEISVTTMNGDITLRKL